MKSGDFRQAALQWLRAKQSKRTHWEEFVRFIVCGVINTGGTFIIYLCLLWVVSYPAAYTISYVAGVFISYWLNARFVFHEALSIARAIQYPVVYLVQYLLGLGLLFLLVEVAHLSDIVAPLLVVILTLPVTFLLSRYVIRRSFGLGERHSETDL